MHGPGQCTGVRLRGQAGRVELLDDDKRPAIKIFTRGRRGSALAAAHQQLNADVGLEIRQALTQRGLHDVQPAGSFRQAAVLDDEAWP